MAASDVKSMLWTASVKVGGAGTVFKKGIFKKQKAYLISWCNFLFAKWKKAQCAPKELQKVKLKVFLAVEAGLRERSCSGDLRGCGGRLQQRPTASRERLTPALREGEDGPWGEENRCPRGRRRQSRRRKEPPGGSGSNRNRAWLERLLILGTRPGCGSQVQGGVRGA